MFATLAAQRLGILCAGLVAVSAVAAIAATSRPERSIDSVAVVDRAQGQVRLERDGVITDLEVGHIIGRHDSLSTGAASRLSVKFNDGSRVTIGENALLVVADYMAEEGRRSGALILELIRGAIRLVASKPREAPHKRVELRAAAATTLSSKGVDLWSGPVDGQLGVLVMRGSAGVRNEAGLVTLSGRRRGTLVSHRMQAPEKPGVWPRARAKELLLTASFK
jgi:hypothetical protein